MFNLFELIARYLVPKIPTPPPCDAPEGWGCIPSDRLGL